MAHPQRRPSRTEPDAVAAACELGMHAIHFRDTAQAIAEIEARLQAQAV
ncbi:MAG TPA: hypothetical protein VE258_01170 [Ktedonobacterales bacterium]|nr:hypothetical protein [Ktedonobacterales bacterium]